MYSYDIERYYDRQIIVKIRAFIVGQHGGERNDKQDDVWDLNVRYVGERKHSRMDGQGYDHRY